MQGPGGTTVTPRRSELAEVNCEWLARPGFFGGVATVCAKLFNIVEPDAVYFGQKDAEQCRVITDLVRDLNFNTEVSI